MTFFNSADTSEDESAPRKGKQAVADADSTQEFAATPDLLDDDVDELDEDFAPRAKERLGVLSIALIVVLVAGIGFLGGVITQKHNTPKTTTASRGSFGGGSALREFASSGGFSGFGGGTGTGSTSGSSSDSDTPSVIGTIVSVSGDTAVVKNLAGKEVTVHLSDDTKITKAATTADLTAGQIVTVSGTTGTDGSVTASSVSTK